MLTTFIILFLIAVLILIVSFITRRKKINLNYILGQKTISQKTNMEFIEMVKNSGMPICIGMITITNNNVYIELKGAISNSAKDTGQYIVNRLKILQCRLPRDMVFFVSLNDGIDFPQYLRDFIRKHILLLLFCDFTENPLGEIIIPDPYMFDESFRETYKKIYDNPIAFNDKIPIAKFKGSQTGGDFNMQEVELLTNPRLKAVHLAAKFPSLLDIKFTSYDTQNTGGREYIKYMEGMFGLPAKSEPFEKFNNYRYLISFDGNFVAYSRPEFSMASGSVPLIQTRYIKYWSYLLENYKNYIKIDDDLGNLVDVIKWLNNNPEKAKMIATNARNLSKKLTPKCMDNYLCDVLNDISEKINLNKNKNEFIRQLLKKWTKK